MYPPPSYVRFIKGEYKEAPARPVCSFVRLAIAANAFNLAAPGLNTYVYTELRSGEHGRTHCSGVHAECP